MKDSNVTEILGNVHSIENFGAFDGPGLRYVLFLQGCPLRCKFCHNRDTWGTEENKLMTVDEILKDYKRFKAFYKGGGLTVSGGEATLQLPFLIELFKAFKKEGIHTCLDTAAGTFRESRIDEFDELLKYTDLVLLDIKHIDDEKHKWLTGATNQNILKFAKYSSDLGVPTVIRHVLLPEINSSDEDLYRLRSFIDTMENVVGIDILPYHKKGIMKWEKMGIPYELGHIEEPTEELISHAENILKNNYKFMK
ncbi:Pyruvate formate-lyase-activating enzyme [Acholeplasma oculi]|uniref:Pyruvate formate-lyase-activating enzyme n=1 Tax=Acholeplasma oculi TaxID=35623 RepID=A0A061AKC9_9MOLU|nr:pyruvate formate-lyase-activating protein [Acholeplasma oculi]CDR31492.1 Pyruvate formate-lyase activating enzyme [Acholeplasma oculi]SKC49344.1 pyruvate formate lyase activating enzyme [Acholeplasma oculi]SUT92242.1 Pyruvate formate-lyase-activating enzyme [Acholeplasma oculi]